MDHTIERDSIPIKTFVNSLNVFCDELEYYCSDLKCSFSAASCVMQDESGQRALANLSELVECIYVQMLGSRKMADGLLQSAELLEKSDDCI